MVSKKFFLGVSAFLISAAAQALPVSLTATAAPTAHLTEGQTKNIQLNVNNLLGGLGSNSITSGVLTVMATSNADYQYLSSSVTNKWNEERTVKVCQPNKPCTWKTYTDKHHDTVETKSYLDLYADTMRVTAGASSANDTVTNLSVQNQIGTKIDDASVENGNGTINFFSHQTNVFRLSVSGDLEVALDLDALALADLTADGILDLSIFAFVGQFDLTSIRLDFEAEERLNPADEANIQVPVPGTLLLTGLGLAALGTLRRRKE